MVSIHHMLLFINSNTFQSGRMKQFQYITCYSLSHCRLRRRELLFCVSIHHMLLFILLLSSIATPPKWFQYITCYSLSVNILQTCGFAVWFQYITCYSLSVDVQRIEMSSLFQYITCYSLSTQFFVFV